MSLIHEPAERSAICSMIQSGAMADALIGLLSPEDFFFDTNRVLFEAIRAVRKQGRSVDLISIREALRIEKGSKRERAMTTRVIETFEAAKEYLSSPANGEFYAGVVKESAWKRRTEAQAKKILELLNDASGDEIRPLVKALGETWYDSVTPAFIQLADVSIDGEDEGVPTGYGAIVDGLTGVGWVAGQNNVVSAYHKGGKTTFMIGSFAHAVKSGKRAAYATFADLNPKQIKRRLLKQECGIGAYPTTRLDLIPDFLEALSFMDDPLGDWSTAWIYDARANGREVETFAAKALVEHARNPLDIVFCDYAQKIGAREVKSAERTRQMEYISNVLDDLAGKLNCPIVLGSQVTKGPDGEWITKYARALEEDAGFVLRVMREDDNQAKVVCAFNRFGLQDVEIPLRWNDARVRFEAYPDAEVRAASEPKQAKRAKK